MSARYPSFRNVPVLGENLGHFTAPNPWLANPLANPPANPLERWSINLYHIVSETHATSAKWNAINQQQKNPQDLATRRQKVQQMKLGFSKSVGIESADGRAHQLPRVLMDMWQAGEVPDAQLPAILHHFEPTLKRSDFKTRRTRTIVKTEGIVFLVIAVLALAGYIALRGTGNSSHRQIRPSQEKWLSQPMTESAVWVQGQAVPIEKCFRVKPGVIHPPAGLTAYGDLTLLCAFQAQNEHRLAIMEAFGDGSVPTTVILRGAVLPPAQLSIEPGLLTAIAQRAPQPLNTSLVFVANVDWQGSANSGDLDDIATILGWAVFICPIPFLIWLVAARFWRAHDRKLQESFRAALGRTYSVPPAQPVVPQY